MEDEGSGWLQTTQPTVQAVVLSRRLQTNCVETSLPEQWGHDLPFLGESRPCARSLALLLMKAGDVETNPSPTADNLAPSHSQHTHM